MKADSHLLILRQADAGNLPTHTDGQSSLPVQTVQDLIDSGYLAASTYRTWDAGPIIKNPRITVSGREHLNKLEERARAASFMGKAGKYFQPLGGWVSGIIGAIIAFVIGTFLVSWFQG